MLDKCTEDVTMKSVFFSITESAGIVGVTQQTLSNGFYTLVLDPNRCVMMGNKRFIPADYLPEIERILDERGYKRNVADTTE